MFFLSFEAKCAQLLRRTLSQKAFEKETFFIFQSYQISLHKISHFSQIWPFFKAEVNLPVKWDDQLWGFQSLL
jgi:hypothetical protein